MLLPIGTVLHRDLSTSFTRFESLMSDLRQNRFSGYIRINFWEYEGVLILDGGKIIQGFNSEKENFLFGEEAIVRIVEKSAENDGTIDVHSLSNEIATTLASVLGATGFQERDVFGGGELKKIFDDLEKKNLTGYVDIQFGGNKGLGTIFLLEGISVDTVIMSNTGRIVEGEAVLKRILDFSPHVKCGVKIFRNTKIEHIQEERVFLLPNTQTAALDYWDFLMKELGEEMGRVFKKAPFVTLWNPARIQLATKYPCLDPKNELLDYRDGNFLVKSFIPLNEFWEGMVESLSLTLHKVPSRKIRKIKLGELVDKCQTKISELPENAISSNYYKVINRIFKVSP